MPIIEARNLSKVFYTSVRKEGLRGALAGLFHRERKTILAVDNVSFDIEEGELVGYIGPNGAGKSTTIKMLTGILYPSGGNVSVCGLSPHRDRVRNAKNIGVVFGQRTQLWWDLPVVESFTLLKRIYDVPDNVYKKNMSDFIEILGLEEFVRKPVRQLSLGQRMRADIAASLIHNPKVLFLDEPTIGLDINVKHRIRDFIKKINRERKITILLTTHDLQDIEELSQRIMIINHGKIIYSGTIEELKRFYDAKRVLKCQLKTPVKHVDLGPYEKQCNINIINSNIIVRFGSQISASDIIAILMKQCDIQDINIEEPSIEDIISEVFDSNA